MKYALPICLLILTPSALWAQSPADGTWAFTMSSPFGAVDATVTLKTEGSRLSGEFDLGEGRKLIIENGTIEGDRMTFRITRNGLMNMTYEMTASVDGDTVSGTAAAMGTEAPWSMQRES